MYITKPADLSIRNAVMQFNTNFAGKPYGGGNEQGTRTLCIYLNTLEDAEALASMGWPIKIYYRGPILADHDASVNNCKKVRELMKRTCLTFDEKRAFLIERNEYSTEFVDFYISAIISFKYPELAPTIMMYMPIQKTAKKMTELNVGTLDRAKVLNMNVLLTASWSKRDSCYKAYVKECHVTIEESPFVNDYSEYTLLEDAPEVDHE